MWRYGHNSIRKEATEESDQKYRQIRKSYQCWGSEHVRACACAHMHTQYIHARQTDHKSKKGKYELKKWKVETSNTEK